ncbi:hypothetical protein GCK32_010602 [Trichostrongylus colubriformis]|uniref:Uncharacterized protein n=1 Tax=Trichostrongylus colubriformis TaxID=6319 RepID=A0AAN8J1Z7_TRICO
MGPPPPPPPPPPLLSHAAARLRKTGYYEQIRGDVPNLSDGRVDGSHERLSDGNRPYGSHFNQLERNPPREQVGRQVRLDVLAIDY